MRTDFQEGFQPPDQVGGQGNQLAKIDSYMEIMVNFTQEYGSCRKAVWVSSNIER